MSALPPRGDESELHAYVDEQLPVERVADVEARLASDPSARARVSGWRVQNELVVQLYEVRAGSCLPRHLWPDRLFLRHRSGLWRVASAALVALMVGGAAGWLAHGLVPTAAGPLDALAGVGMDLQRMAARGDLPHPLEPDRRQLNALLSRAFAHEVRIPDLAIVGLDLVGGRALPIAVSKAAAQLVYADADGARVTLYLVRPDPFEGADFQPVSEAGFAGLLWPYTEFHCLLVGALPPARLLAISQAVQAQLDLEQAGEG